LAANTEDAADPAQGGAFVVGGQDLFLELCTVAERRGVLTTAFLAGIALIFLLAIEGHAIASEPITATMAAEDNLRNHDPAHTVLSILDHYPIF
jgi:hypothetical protein